MSFKDDITTSDTQSDTDTVLFLTIGKPDIYELKSLGESTTVFYLGDK
jgi:hypothetical protein